MTSPYPILCIVFILMRVARKIGPVVALAEMRGYDMLQPSLVDAGQQRRGRFVVKMAKAARDARLQTLGIVAHAQHLGIVIAFEEQRIASVQTTLHVDGHVACVRQHA